MKNHPKYDEHMKLTMDKWPEGLMEYVESHPAAFCGDGVSYAINEWLWKVYPMEYSDIIAGPVITHKHGDGDDLSYGEHQLTPECWCHPKLVYENSENGNQVWEHFRNVGTDEVM